MIALAVAAVLGSLALGFYANARWRSYKLATARQRAHPRAARVGFLLGMVAAWVVQGCALAAFYLAVIR